MKVNKIIIIVKDLLKLKRVILVDKNKNYYNLPWNLSKGEMR